MKRSFIAITLTGLSQAAWSMDFQCGDWPGDVTMHNEKAATVIFRVKQQDTENMDELKIIMFYNERPYVFEELVIDDDGMNFTLDTGDKYMCELEPDGSGGYQGGCLYQEDAEERHIPISMAPPEEVYEECNVKTDDQTTE